MEAHIGQHISQATEMQTLCWSKIRLSFSCADNSYISWPINTIFVPRIGMHININILEWISFISRFGATVSYFVRGDIFLLTLYEPVYIGIL